MNKVLRTVLRPQGAQAERLRSLQLRFAEACNALAPTVQSTRCWNRVALHHMVYRPMRERFPDLGSQMICNAIYSVSRSARRIYQHPRSPFNVQKNPQAPLPLIRFTADAPVFFDRHTLSLRDGQVSLMTLDGRMRFDLPLADADLRRFKDDKLREIRLQRRDAQYELMFSFAAAASDADAPDATAEGDDDLPHYLVVDEAQRGDVGAATDTLPPSPRPRHERSTTPVAAQEAR